MKYLSKNKTDVASLNPIQDGLYDALCPLPKICHTYPTKMKLGTAIPYLKQT